MEMPLSKVKTRLPARSRSNSCGAKAANEHIATEPLLPEFAGTMICARLFSAVLFAPVAHTIMSKFRVVDSLLLKSTSSTMLALAAPVAIKVSVLMAKPDASFVAGYVPVSVAKDN